MLGGVGVWRSRLAFGVRRIGQMGPMGQMAYELFGGG
jgi:hypothetical protein